MEEFDAGQFLRKHGWVKVHSMLVHRKNGDMRIVRWSKPETEWQNINQGLAIRIERESIKDNLPHITRNWDSNHNPICEPHCPACAAQQSKGEQGSPD